MAGSEFALVLAGDETYARGIAVALHSAIATLSPSVKPQVFVLDNNLSEPSRARLLKVFKAARPTDDLRWIQISDDQLPLHLGRNHVTGAAYSRLLIPTVLPDHIRRAVYLDADVLVRRDLSPLFAISLGDASVAAVRDFMISSTAHPASGVRERAQPRPYFNTGVLVMDLVRWRTEGLAEQALRYASADAAPLPYADQDALNAVVGKWHELDHRWNVQHTHFFRDRLPSPTELSGRLYPRRWELFRHAAVLHFIGGRKPWSGTCTTPGRGSWARSLIASGWYRRHEAAMWLFRYLGELGRFRLAAKRVQYAAALRRRRT